MKNFWQVFCRVTFQFDEVWTSRTSQKQQRVYKLVVRGQLRVNEVLSVLSNRNKWAKGGRGGVPERRPWPAIGIRKRFTASEFSLAGSRRYSSRRWKRSSDFNPCLSPSPPRASECFRLAFVRFSSASSAGLGFEVESWPERAWRWQNYAGALVRLLRVECVEQPNPSSSMARHKYRTVTFGGEKRIRRLGTMDNLPFTKPATVGSSYRSASFIPKLWLATPGQLWLRFDRTWVNFNFNHWQLLSRGRGVFKFSDVTRE